jgi:acetoacetyl-CoA reductase
MPAEQRTALVAGGSGGLGEAIARALHDAGHTVLIIHSPGNANIGAWLETQAGEGYNFVAYGADVADHARCQELAERIHADGHRIDILVNNAGITRDATFRKLSYADWDAVPRVNLDSVFNVPRPFIDGMLERGWGGIINISSINGSKGQFGQTNYSAAKAGMHGFTKAPAREAARKGVTVNTVSLGYLNTKMVKSMPEDLVKQVVAGIPVGRLGRPGEIAALVALIASESAGSAQAHQICILQIKNWLTFMALRDPCSHRHRLCSFLPFWASHEGRKRHAANAGVRLDFRPAQRAACAPRPGRVADGGGLRGAVGCRRLRRHRTVGRGQDRLAARLHEA